MSFSERIRLEHIVNSLSPAARQVLSDPDLPSTVGYLTLNKYLDAMGATDD